MNEQGPKVINMDGQGPMLMNVALMNFGENCEHSDVECINLCKL